MSSPPSTTTAAHSRRDLSRPWTLAVMSRRNGCGHGGHRGREVQDPPAVSRLGRSVVEAGDTRRDQHGLEVSRHPVIVGMSGVRATPVPVDKRGVAMSPTMSYFAWTPAGRVPDGPHLAWCRRRGRLLAARPQSCPPGQTATRRVTCGLVSVQTPTGHADSGRSPARLAPTPTWPAARNWRDLPAPRAGPSPSPVCRTRRGPNRRLGPLTPNADPPLPPLTSPRTRRAPLASEASGAPRSSNGAPVTRRMPVTWPQRPPRYRHLIDYNVKEPDSEFRASPQAADQHIQRSTHPEMPCGTRVKALG